jgi:hypothetical protein
MEGTCVSVVLTKRLEAEREEYEVRGVKSDHRGLLVHFSLCVSVIHMYGLS